MGQETYRTQNGNQSGYATRQTVSDQDMSNAAVASKSAAGLGSLEKNSGGEPKQLPNESVGAYAARLRAWRSANDTTTQARNKALGGS